jgi:thiol:disulfide interchange protein DsbD
MVLLLGFAQPEESPVQVQLIAEQTSIQPGGQTRIGILLTIQAGWHIYGENPGDAGLATSLMWSLPNQATVGALNWPPPETFVEPGEIHTFGYTGKTLLSSSLTLDAHVEPEGILPIGAAIEWLACKDICLPGSATLTLELPISAQPPTASSHTEWFSGSAHEEPL